VSGPKSNNGKPGNWAIWGAVNNDTTLKNFKHFYNYPYRWEKEIMIEKEKMNRWLL